MLRGVVFDTPPKFSLRLATRLPERFAVVVTHQGEWILDKTDRAVTQVVGLPSPFGNTSSSEQNLGDHAIGVAIERAKRQRQSLRALRRQFMECGARSAVIERTPGRRAACVRMSKSSSNGNSAA